MLRCVIIIPFLVVVVVVIPLVTTNILCVASFNATATATAAVGAGSASLPATFIFQPLLSSPKISVFVYAHAFKLQPLVPSLKANKKKKDTQKTQNNFDS